MLTSDRFVQYVDQDTAELYGLINITSRGSIYLGVDYMSTLGGGNNGRKSVRIESIPAFTQGLLVADIEHMPGSVCGAWPTFWTFGEDWPQDGEIVFQHDVLAYCRNVYNKWNRTDRLCNHDQLLNY
ncbi:hypothetical protein Egran_00985 [Elaphomyces granulatus]|uniref:GH16 domain-containing protein n=1 Tax=Elaphomyces granulatus TaxID=519963 RepID=A0A232M4J3_9EURO|nr:hypothetical protein Egran_00985 [Elaphomyces granulatus]